MDISNESFMRDNTKKQMDKINREITAEGGDIGAISNTNIENNGVYMDNPFIQNKRHIDTYEHYIKNDAIIKTPTDKTNNSKFGKVTKMSESTDMDKYENVVFLQGEEAEEPLRILNDEGEDAALEYLMQWHDVGNHEGTDELNHSENDNVYEVGNYIMSWNNRLGYIGLQYEFDVNEKLNTDSIKPNTKYRKKINVEDKTKEETHDKAIIWKYEDFIINGSKHVNTNTVDDKDRPFINNKSDDKESDLLNNKVGKEMKSKLKK